MLPNGRIALLLCTAAHPLYTGIAIIFGTSISESITRPNPTSMLVAGLGVLALGAWVGAASVAERSARASERRRIMPSIDS